MSDRTPKFRPVSSVVKFDEAGISSIVGRIKACEDKIKELTTKLNRLEGAEDGSDDIKRGPGRPKKEAIHA